MNFKNIIIALINKTNKNLFCYIRNILENIFFNQKFNLKYSKDGFYIRSYYKLNQIYFSNKFRTIMYGRGASFRLNSLAKSYFIDKININNNDLVVDCGANIGEINLYFKNINTEINYYAFEPSEKDFKCLKHNSKSNNLYNYALWNQNSDKTFFIKSNSADSSVFEIDDYEKKSIVKAISLDSLNLKKIKLFKVEAEGAEPEVLMGAINTLKECEYVVVDSGKERGKKKEETTIFVINFLLQNNFELIYINHERITLMFKNKLI